MLVLVRKRNEGITISHPDGDIHIVVVEIRGDKVRIGIEALKSVSINRDEVWRAIQRDEAQTHEVQTQSTANQNTNMKDKQK